MRVLIVLMGLCGLLLAGSPLDAQAPPYTYRDVNCLFPKPDPTLRCGQLTVPENYTDPQNSPTVTLQLVVIPALNDPLPDPVIYLEGGPGGSALLSVDNWISHPVRVNRDLVIFDQRGAGFSTPSLNCIEFEVNDPRATYQDPVTGCRKRLEEAGVDLSQYHSLNNAHDVEMLRQALGYDQINLYGISYGTRLALTYMREYPDQVRSAVLDSVFPPEIDFLGERTFNRVQAFRALFDACSANADCRQAYPNLEEEFYALIERYNEAPNQLEDPPLWMPAVIDGDELAEAFFRGMYRTEALPMLPYGIHRLYRAQDEDEFIVGYQLMRGYVTPASIQPGWEPPASIMDSWEVKEYMWEVGNIDFAEGVNFSVDCAEEFVFSDPDASVSADSQIIREELMSILLRSVQAARARCSAWDVERRDVLETERVRSDAPTLLLSGAFDPITSVAWAISAGAGLPNSRQIVFSYAGHAVSAGDPCAAMLVTAHINAPSLKPAAECATTPRVDFYIR